MKILVTGGAGFIGANLVRFLEKRDNEIVIVDDLSTGNYENIAGTRAAAKFYLCDIRNAEIHKIFDIEQPDMIIHLAAQSSVPASIKNPALDLDINLNGLLNLLRANRNHKNGKVIFISTGGAIYGDATIIPTSEEYIPSLISPYALTKYTSEKYLRIYSNLFGLKYSVLRLANVYGPRQIPKGESGVIPIFFEKCLANLDAVIYCYPDMPNGTSRDYVFVEDVCRAIELCITEGDGETFNIGSGIETYTKEIFDEILQLTESRSKLVLARERTGDVRRSLLDITKAASELCWSPHVQLREGLSLTYEYMKSSK